MIPALPLSTQLGRHSLKILEGNKVLGTCDCLENRILGLNLCDPRKAFALLFKLSQFLQLLDALPVAIMDEALCLKPPLLNGIGRCDRPQMQRQLKDRSPQDQSILGKTRFAKHAHRVEGLGRLMQKEIADYRKRVVRMRDTRHLWKNFLADHSIDVMIPDRRQFRTI